MQAPVTHRIGCSRSNGLNIQDHRNTHPLQRKGGSGDRSEPDRPRQARYHLVTDRRGIPLAFLLTSANVNESVPFEARLDAVPPVSGKRGRPRRKPGKLHADKAYDHRRCRDTCRRRGITTRIVRRGIESSQKLGRHRWVIERTFAWMARYRRLTIRYERRIDIHHAFTSLACSPSVLTLCN